MQTSPTPRTDSAAAATENFDTRSAVVLLFDGDRDEASRVAARQYAADLAVAADTAVIVYDRTEETWGDSQHPEGPLSATDAEQSGRSELAEELRAIAQFGARARGWVASLPSISAVTTPLAELGARVVIVPEQMGRKILERALVGGSVAEALAQQIDRNPELEVPVVEVSPSGTPSLVSAS